MSLGGPWGGDAGLDSPLSGSLFLTLPASSQIMVLFFRNLIFYPCSFHSIFFFLYRYLFEKYLGYPFLSLNINGSILCILFLTCILHLTVAPGFCSTAACRDLRCFFSYVTLNCVDIWSLILENYTFQEFS